MFQPRLRGISLNKNAINIQANQQQQQAQVLPLRTPSPPQLKSQVQQQQPNKELLLLQNQNQNQLLPQQQQQPLQSLAKHLDRSENDEIHQLKKLARSKIPRLFDQLKKDSAEEAVVETKEEPIEDIDNTDSRDAIFLVSDLAKDIYNYMYELENCQSVRADYLKDQKIMTPRVRQRLVNWCIEIHHKLKLLPETLYTTISIIDRYFDKVIVKQQSQVQLVACGATMIASKYEEIYPPELNDLITLSANTYTRRDIMRVEIEILETLKFDLGKPIPLAFLRRFSKAAHCDLKMHSIAKFLMELSLSEYECSHWNPSQLAAASLYTTRHLLNPNDPNNWNKTMVHYSRYSHKQLQEPASTICKILKRVLKSPQNYTTAKKNAMNLSKWVELKSSRVDGLIIGQSAS